MKGEWSAHDITKVTDDDIRELERTRGHISAICGGFPCQSFSVAGKRGGFADTRGTLFFEIARFASILRPEYLFLENVAGLLNHNGGDTFETILRTLDELGYHAEWQVLNSKDFGVPQNRERVFIIGHLGGGSGRKVFPIEGQGNENSTLAKSTETAIARTFTAGGHSARNHSGMTIIQLNDPTHSNNRVYASEGIAPTLNTMQGGHRQPFISVHPCLTPAREEKRQNGPRFKGEGEPMFTLTAQDVHGVALQFIGGVSDEPNWLDDGKELSRNFKQGSRIYDAEGLATSLSAQGVGGPGGYSGLYKTDCRIRKLTPRECWRLQAFPEWAFERAAAVVSPSQLYKQAGNSVAVHVIRAIAERLYEITGQLTFLDLFAGIGGFRLGMEQAGHKCVGHVEWDKYARMSYEAIHLAREATP